MTTGITSTGFIAPTQDDIAAEIGDEILSTVNAGLDLSPDQPIGQIVGIISEKIAEVWEAVATVYNALNPDAAEGNLLTNVCAITGTVPQAATYSYVVATLNVNASTTVPVGSVVHVSGQPANRWVLVGTDADPPGNGQDVHNTGTSPASLQGLFRSENPGPFVANATTLTAIDSPVVGWNSITNAADAVPGLSADSDTTLRAKRDAELSGEGAGDLDAVRAAVLKVPGVVSAFVFENTALVEDTNGLPGKAFRVVVWDGEDASASDDAIAAAIWTSKPSGIQAFGATQGTVVDSQGITRLIAFDRAEQVPIWVVCTTTPATLTTQQHLDVKAAIAAHPFSLGQPVVALALRAAALGVDGVVTDVPSFSMGVSSLSLSTANITLTPLQIATISTTHVTVNGT